MPRLTVGLCSLLDQDIITQLSAEGIVSVLDFVSANPNTLSASSKIPKETILSIRKKLLAEYSSFPVSGGKVFDQCVETVSILSTASSDLDDILCSGIYTGEVTQIQGPASSGKTQFCSCLAVDVACSIEKNVLYIDGSNGFSARRAAEILKSRCETANAKKTLSRIRVTHCLDAYGLLDTITALSNLLNSGDPFALSMKMVIIDSINSITEPTFINTAYAEVQSMVTLIKQELGVLARKFVLAVVVVAEKAPSIAGTWDAASSTTLEFKRPEGPKIQCGCTDHLVQVAVVKSPRFHGVRSINLKISKDGLRS